MKKILNVLFVLMLMCCYLNVSAKSYNYDNWNTTLDNKNAGSKEKISNHNVVIKGNSYFGESESDCKDDLNSDWCGMKVGPFIESNSKLEDGIKEELYIKPVNLKQGEYFELSYSFKDIKGEYVNEINITTKYLDEDNSQVTINGIDENTFKAIISKDNIYKYSFNVYEIDNVAYLKFEVVDEENGTTQSLNNLIKIDDTFKGPDVKKISESEGVSLRWIWFCNVQVENGINLYNLSDAKLSNDNIVTTEEKTQDVLNDSLSNSEYAKETKFIDTTIGVEMNDEDIDSDDIKQIEDSISSKLKDAKISKYFDIKVAIRNASNNDLIGNLENLNEAIELELEIPLDIEKVKDGYTRTYYIIRNHNGEIDVLDTNIKDGKFLTFKTDKFSTYAITYIDTLTVDAPNTLDNISLSIGLSLVSITGIILITIYMKKKKA